MIEARARAIPDVDMVENFSHLGQGVFVTDFGGFMHGLLIENNVVTVYLTCAFCKNSWRIDIANFQVAFVRRFLYFRS